MILTEVKTLALSDVTQTVNGESVDLSRAESVAIVCNITVDTVTAKTFTTDATTDTLTTASHGYKTGLKGQVSSTLTLPGGLAAATDYYVILVDDNSYKLATSYANAVAGTAIDITDAGTGVHTFTPAALAGGMITVQYSLDNSTYVDLEAGTAITASSTFTKLIDRPAYPFLRLAYTLTAGQLSVINKVAIKN